MQPNLNYFYPPIFWVEGIQNSSVPPPLPPRVCTRASTVPASVQRKKRKICGSWLATLILCLLLLALAGVALGSYYILELQNELQQLKEFTSTGKSSPAFEKLIGLRNITSEKKETQRIAHITGKLSKSNPLLWEHVYGDAFTFGIEYRNGGLFINETGYYFVYSKVFFRAQSCLDLSSPLIHTVFRRTPRYPKDLILMESSFLRYCNPGQGSWYRNSYLGAVFRLTALDTLYVNVSDTKMVNLDEKNTFFGLYKL